MIPKYACNYQISDYAKYCENSTLYKSNTTCLCNNINWLASVLGCLSYEGKLETKSIQGVKKFCRINGGVELTQERVGIAYRRYIDSVTDASLTTTPGVSIIVDEPILLLTLEVHLYRRAYEKYLGNFDDSIYYGTAVYGYWTIVLLLAAIVNWGKLIFPTWSNSSLRLIQKHVILPALGAKSKAQTQSLGPIEFIVPSRFEALILGLFMVLLAMLALINTDPVEGDPIYYTKSNAQLRYVVDRSGIISTMLGPLVVLFAGRNNLLLWITRWQHARFLTLHRWVARTMVVLALIHAIGYTRLLGTFYHEEIKAVYLKAGVVALVASILMLIQGVLFIRRRWYEIFLVMHIVLGVCWLVGCWTHVNELGFVYFFYPVAIAWGIDRFARIIRLLLFGYPLANIELITNDLMRIDIPVPESWQNRDNIGYAFIYILRANCFWQSHPFTFMHSIITQKRIVCYCRVKGGLTDNLRHYLLYKSNNHARIRVGVEGPYGSSPPVNQTDLMVFVAGGSGISGIYQEVTCRTKCNQRDFVVTVKLIWIVRDFSFIRWFYAELKALEETSVIVMVYITGVSAQLRENGVPQDGVTVEKEVGHEMVSLQRSPSMPLLDDVDHESGGDLSFIEFLYGRFDVTQLVITNIEECKTSVSFITCGHPKMVDDLRVAVCQSINSEPDKEIHFYDQLEVWA